MNNITQSPFPDQTIYTEESITIYKVNMELFKLCISNIPEDIFEPDIVEICRYAVAILGKL